MSDQVKCTCPEDKIPWHNNPDCSMAQGSPPYRVMQRPDDGVWCIYATEFNVIVAEFVSGAATDAKIIASILDPSEAGNNPILPQTGR